MRRNAESAARDAAIQHAIAGAGEHIWTQAQAEQDELIELTERADRARPARRDDPSGRARRPTSGC